MKRLFTLVFGVLPSSRLRILLLNLIGHKISRDVSLGVNLYWNVGSIQMARGARISNLNVFKNVSRIALGEKSSISNLNWVTGSSQLFDEGAPCELVLEAKAVVTSRHYLDTSGGIYCELGSALTGVRSTIISHGVDYRTNKQSWRNVIIGERTLIGSNALIVPGTQVPSFSVFGMGCLLSPNLNTESKLYLNPVSIPKQSISRDNAFFKR